MVRWRPLVAKGRNDKTIKEGVAAEMFVFIDNCYLGSFAIQLSSTGGGSGVEMVLVLMSPMRTRASFRA